LIGAVGRSDSVRRVDQDLPHTVASLAADLRALGLSRGDVVVMHSSLKSIGDVAGGAQTVVQALLDVLGPGGTLVVPTHTPNNTDPAGWRNPPVPESWWPVLRHETPGFDPDRTPPSIWMGMLPCLVRTWPGALRSSHPHVSFAALGPHAAGIVAGHRYDDALGDTSPLGAVYRLDGKVLLLGCDHSSNTSLHLAEWRQPDPPRAERGAAVLRPDGTSHWTTWTDVAEDEDDFAELGTAFEDTGAATLGQVGDATAHLMSQRAVVDFATAWIAANRS
jgi:aminoglycoside 3-N-acetyltransferase